MFNILFDSNEWLPAHDYPVVERFCSGDATLPWSCLKRWIFSKFTFSVPHKCHVSRCSLDFLYRDPDDRLEMSVRKLWTKVAKVQLSLFNFFGVSRKDLSCVPPRVFLLFQEKQSDTSGFFGDTNSFSLEEEATATCWRRNVSPFYIWS